MSQAVATPTLAKQRTFLGHPLGLYVLFFTEMWERFSYYGMRALLILYMTNYFKMSQKDASSIYKWYTSLVYLTPLLGGYLADRYLGNVAAVVIGAILMAIGHFLMAFEQPVLFYSALTFLILGNGFFKPNMATQIGRLYTRNDPRRDGAYTIYYMGVNLGAFLAPLACGWLQMNTVGEYHSGFTLAGIGMVIGLLTYVFGLPLVRPLPPEEAVSPDNNGKDTEAAKSEDELARTPSVVPYLTSPAPLLLGVLGVLIVVLAPSLAMLGWIAWNNAIALTIVAIASFASAWILSQIRLALRDRVLAILVLGVFVVFFWAAFEQAGNVLNVWADKTTNRQITGTVKPPALHPDLYKEDETIEEDQAQAFGLFERFGVMFRLKAKQPATEVKQDQGFEAPAAWFQSINAAAIFVFAPLFAILWVWLDRRKWNPSTPTKMALGLVLMAMSLAIMVAAAAQENHPTLQPLRSSELPAGLTVNADNQICPLHRGPDGKEQPGEAFDAGRLSLDPKDHEITVNGVFSDTERDRVLRETAPKDFKERLAVFRTVTASAPPRNQPAREVTIDLPHKPASNPETWFPEAQPEYKSFKKGDRDVYQLKVTVRLPVTLHLGTLPPGYHHSYAGLKKSEVAYDAQAATLTARRELLDKDIKGLQVAGADSSLREALNGLMVHSSKYRVSMWWLFWTYVLATLGELCLSPVGLAMVSRLAPARFATMLMGLWMLTSTFGNFVAGACGELYESVPPTQFFSYFVLILSGAAVILFLLIRKIVTLMHGVN